MPEVLPLQENVTTGKCEGELYVMKSDKPKQNMNAGKTKKAT